MKYVQFATVIVFVLTLLMCSNQDQDSLILGPSLTNGAELQKGTIPSEGSSVSDPQVEFDRRLANIHGRVFVDGYGSYARELILDNDCSETFPSGGISGQNNWIIKIYSENRQLVYTTTTYTDISRGAGWFVFPNVTGGRNYRFEVYDDNGQLMMNGTDEFMLYYPLGYNSCTAINITGPNPEPLLPLNYCDIRLNLVVGPEPFYPLDLDIDDNSNLVSGTQITASGTYRFNSGRNFSWGPISFTTGSSASIDIPWASEFAQRVSVNLTSSSPSDGNSSNNSDELIWLGPPITGIPAD